MSAAHTPFEDKAPGVVAGFIKFLALQDFQAAGIVGNCGQESGLLAIQERHPARGRGGFGWPQWTGSRRTGFEKFCRDNKRDETNDAANFA